MEILGIDIGGSGIKGAVINTGTGQLTRERYRIPTPHPSKPEAVIKKIARLVGHFNWEGPVGCGFPAVIQKGIVRTAVNIDSTWLGVNVAELLREGLNCPASVLNDADAAGIAEMTFGAGKGQEGLTVMITVGTGIGTAVFTGGQLLPNTELGHVYLKKKIAEPYVSDATRKKEDLSWKKWAGRFNEYLAEIEKILWPELIIIGGGVSKKFDKYSRYLATRASLVPAQLRNEAGMIGAALYAKSTLK